MRARLLYIILYSRPGERKEARLKKHRMINIEFYQPVTRLTLIARRT